jgi:rhodanese-related sulfurtransferase
VQRLASSLVLLLALVVAACGGSTAVQADPFVRVGASQFAELAQEAPDQGWSLIDLRTNEEVAAGFIEGSSQIDFYAPDFEARLDALPKDVPYLIYCNSGNRSGTTLRIMKDLGFEQVTELEGGIQAWIASDLPLVTP